MIKIQPPEKWHSLKCDAEPFAAVSLGYKRAEFRQNDRGFREGDGIVLHEYKSGRATSRKIDCVITHIQQGFGIPIGYVMLSIHPL